MSERAQQIASYLRDEFKASSPEQFSFIDERAEALASMDSLEKYTPSEIASTLREQFLRLGFEKAARNN